MPFDMAFFVAVTSQQLDRCADAVEGVVNLPAEGRHDSNHNDGDQSKNDRVLDEALAFFFGCK